MVSVAPIKQIGLSPNWSNVIQVSGKRTIDIIGSLLFLLLAAPLLVVIAALIKLTTAGPVFYQWRVVGEGGRPFTGFKFRSMYVDAEHQKLALLSNNEMQGPVFKMTNDPRVTPLGRYLRKYSLDELPQLLSVLKGDMSLVGPRPPLQSEYAHFTQWQKLKLQVKPGITCFWQVNGRNDIKNLDDWVRLDLEYIQNWSLLMDLKILANTIPAVISGKGR